MKNDIEFVNCEKFLYKVSLCDYFDYKSDRILNFEELCRFLDKNCSTFRKIVIERLYIGIR